MSCTNTRAVSSSQHGPAQLTAEFQPPHSIDLQARKLSRRFALAPATARAIAALAFAAEVRS